MPTQPVPLSRHVEERLAGRGRFAAEMQTILNRIAFIGRRLSNEIARAPFLGRLGLAGADNRSGEAQKKLDVVANDLLVEGFSGLGTIAMILSEELDDPLWPDGGGNGPYVLCIDPIDGSSNTEINGPLGTVFGVYERRGSGSGREGPGARPQGADSRRQAAGAGPQGAGGGHDNSLPSGSKIVASGYVLYGPSTLLVYTTGDGAFGFTLDSGQGEFLLTHDRIRCPERGKYYSANLGSRRGWHPNIGRYLDWVTESDPATGRPYSLRYIGALVADLHRSLIEGGLYFYPGTEKKPDGKLRLLYECAPLAFLTEQAGGRASTGNRRILEVETREAHQRTPLVIGSAGEVALYEAFLRNGKPD
jgi:fructose-1,6-bisphosphatase I